MDQDHFRRMLATPQARGSSTLGAAATSRAKLAVPTKKQPVEPPQPAFKPRKVKKTADSKYRDRAAERRDGEGNDYAHVEAILEDFEKRNEGEDKNTIDAQRKYLGGDGEHSVLVKGLDFALFEQNKATSTLTKDDVDELEQAFAESSSHAEPTAAKKRTRQDLIEDLKRQRAEQRGKASPLPHIDGEGKRSLEQTGKFKPIGFKSIGSTSTKKKKSTMEGGDGEKKKKKRKIEESSAETPSSSIARPHVPPTIVEIPKEPEPIDEGLDIFADAGEYEGIDVDGSDDEPSQIGKEARQKPQKEEDLDDAPRHWIPMNESIPPLRPEPKAKSPPPQPASAADSGEEMQDERPMRLVPLESSALPSIKDLLAMDKASTSHDKNKKRKEKKKKKKAAGDDDDD